MEKRRGRKKGYIMSEEQKQAISQGMKNYYETMTPLQKIVREKANENLREFWRRYKKEMELKYEGKINF